MNSTRKEPFLKKMPVLSHIVLSLVIMIFGTVLFPKIAHLEDTNHSSKTSHSSDLQRETESYSHNQYPEKLETEHKEQGSDMEVKVTPEMLKLAGIRTAKVDYRPLTKEIQTVGEITYDERRLKIASAWIGGRIDKLFVDFTGEKVGKGEPLVEIYSPELVATQQEYLLALKTSDQMRSSGNLEALNAADDLEEATRRRLILWGITEKQIENIQKNRDISTHMTIHAPIGGIVIHKNATEGQYVKIGEKLYTIADLSVVWAMVDVYEYEMAWVEVGQIVSISTPAYPGQNFTGTVSFIDPFLNRQTRSVKVRMDVPNKNLILKPGMFVDARLKIPVKMQRSELSIPYTAVLDTGVRKLVYIDMGNGLFKAVEIEVGQRAGEWVQVLSGLKKGQKVVVSANYLLDSQRTLGVGSDAYGGTLGGGHKGGH